MADKFINIRHAGELDSFIDEIGKTSGEATKTGAVKYAVLHFRSLLLESEDLRDDLKTLQEKFYDLEEEHRELRSALQIVKRFSKIT